MNREIPGYYYDEEKKKYFKIERTRTAPEGAAWSKENVKRRKIEEEKKEGEKRRQERMRIVKRSRLGGHLGKAMGIASVFGEDTLVSSYVPRDEDDAVNFDGVWGKYPGWMTRAKSEPLPFPQASSMACHEPSWHMFFTSRRPTRSIMLGSCKPWLLPRPPDRYSRFTTIESNHAHFHREGWSNTVAAAPASSNLTCLVGTSSGVIQLHPNSALTWLTPKPTGTLSLQHSHLKPAARAARGEIFSLDFLPSNPSDVLLVGGRFRHICLLDRRAPEEEWISVKHTSSIAHVKAVGPYEVLAAGPQSAMAVYDVRWMGAGGPRKKSWAANGAKPVVEFPGYQNEAHLHIGLDVLRAPGYGMGVVAAAHDDGRVALFALRDGSRLRSPAVDGINYGAGGRVVASAKFGMLPGDRHPSLFVGEAAAVGKYSFGRGRMDCVDW
ncbi:hypothetical protein B0T16DRAFT_450059 [Cercophora newfieldiana]|uniref:Myocyte-specific enhancer factor 2d n=1 Tax=Cercophora newfieldiana TaxID=92897 RepID=A0AA40CHR6_9PEZI|nr:hypothetical protein B0T16DRAFT_450059 [Cercophora newfieldiana]